MENYFLFVFYNSKQFMKKKDLQMNIRRILMIKPQSLGVGLTKVKNKFGVIGENLTSAKGERVYKTKDGNTLVIKSDFCLDINKVLSKENLGNNYNTYIESLAGWRREYSNIGDLKNMKWLRHLKFLTESFFVEKNTPISRHILIPEGEPVIKGLQDGSVVRQIKTTQSAKDIYV